MDTLVALDHLGWRMGCNIVRNYMSLSRMIWRKVSAESNIMRSSILTLPVPSPGSFMSMRENAIFLDTLVDHDHLKGMGGCHFLKITCL